MVTEGGLKNRSGILQLLVVFMLFFGAVMVSAFFASLILQIFGYNTLTDPGALQDHTEPGVLPAIKFFQVFSSVGGFALPPIVFAYLIGEKPLQFLRFKRSFALISAVFVVLMFMSIQPAVSAFGELNNTMHLPDWLDFSFEFEMGGEIYRFEGIEQWMRDSEDSMGELTKALLNMPNIGSLLFNLFMLALLPALGEEMIFRGTIQQVISRRVNVHVAVWVTAILFSAIHFQFFSFIPRMLLGAVLGYLFVWSGNIWYPILGHFTNNALAVVLHFFMQRDMVSEDVENIGSGDGMWLYAFISMALCGLIGFGFYRRFKAAT